MELILNRSLDKEQAERRKTIEAKAAKPDKRR